MENPCPAADSRTWRENWSMVRNKCPWNYRARFFEESVFFIYILTPFFHELSEEERTYAYFVRDNATPHTADDSMKEYSIMVLL